MLGWVYPKQKAVYYIMMTVLQSLSGGLRRQFSGHFTNPRAQIWLRAAVYFLSGLVLSATSLCNFPMPIAVGLVAGCTGTGAILAAVGGALGYLLFWGQAGVPCLLWVACVLVATAFLSPRWGLPLIPAVAALVVSVLGVAFQLWLGQQAPVMVYLLRVGLAGGSSWLFYQVLRRRDPILEWLTAALAVLALAQISLGVYLNLGLIAGAALTVAGSFPGAILAGAALDLAQISSVSMTCVFCIGCLVRFLPDCPRWLRVCACAVVYWVVCNLDGYFSLYPIPAMLLGGFLGLLLPMPGKLPLRRGETGAAQVRLELAAGAMYQMEQILLEQPDFPVDEDAILERAARAACSGCSCRAGCRDSDRLLRLPAALLHKNLLSIEELPIICRKSGRFLAELHRGQEQLRSIHGQRQRQQEYREAVIQQYRFLGEYMENLSDQLARKPESSQKGYQATVEVFSNRSDGENGDRCCSFTATRGLQYVIICDGMGTGIGAAEESKTALQLLKRLLCAGYTAPAALQCLNSICALRSRAGAVTVDLLEVSLSTGRSRLYKWGAAPSYLLSPLGAQQIGTPGPPPGLSVTEQTQKAYKFSLAGAQRLVLISDGVPESEALHQCALHPDAPAGDLARELLRQSIISGQDDATVAIVGLQKEEG